MNPNDPFLDLSKTVIGAYDNGRTVEDEEKAREVIASATTAGGTSFWGKYPQDYQHVIFGKGLRLPGTCKVSGTGFEQRLKRDQPAGTHGHSVKQLGIQPSKFDIRIQLWTEEQLEDFARLIPVLKQQRYKTTKQVESVGFTGLDPFADTSRNLSTRLNEHGFVPIQNQSTVDPIFNEAARITPTTKVIKNVSVPVGPAPIAVYHPMLALFKIRMVHIVSVSLPEPTSGDPGIWECVIKCEEFVEKRTSTVKTADHSMDIIEANPRIGRTAITNALNDSGAPPVKKPSGNTAP